MPEDSKCLARNAFVQVSGALIQLISCDSILGEYSVGDHEPFIRIWNEAASVGIPMLTEWTGILCHAVPSPIRHIQLCVSAP